MYRLFKNTSKQTAVILPKAKRVEFLNHVYVTNKPVEIELLEQLAKDQECGVYFDPEDTEVDEGDVAKIRSGMIPFRRQHMNAASSQGAGTAGTKNQAQAGIANTSTIIGGHHSDAISVKVAGDKSDGDPIEVSVPSRKIPGLK